MSHDHDHGHGHGHHHHGTPGKLGVAFALNLSFTLVELVGAYLTNSTAIAADAVHDLGDSLALAFAWGMETLSTKEATSTYTYGFKRLSLVGAFVNVVVLLVGGALVLFESVPRLFDPPDAHAPGMLALAVLGVVVNGAAVWKVSGGTSMNEQVVTWHLLEDVMGWVAVLIVSVVMLFAEVPILDPLLSVAITLWVSYNALKGLKRTLDLFLQAVPSNVDVAHLEALIAALPGVQTLQHVHVWSLEGDHHVLTGQLVMDACDLEQAVQSRDHARAILEAEGIEHVTLEMALHPDGPGAHCGPTTDHEPHEHHH